MLTAQTNNRRKIRVLVADDHVTVVAGLASIIGMQPDMEVVAEATNGREAVDLALRMNPDVMLVDLRMPLLDGVGVLNEIRTKNTAVRTVVLTTFDSELDIYRAIKAGAKAYLLKDARRDELLNCIRKVYSGEAWMSQALMKKLADGISSESITDRELEVLDRLAHGKSNKEIGVALHISEFTVKGHLRSIFTKLGVMSRTEAINAASKRGLVHLT